MNTRTAAVTALAVTVIGTLYLLSTSSSSTFKMSAPEPPSAEIIPGIEFKLSQISRSPPSLLVTLKNNNPSSTFTLLKWGTPLDVQAQNLGVFKVTDADSGKEIPVDIIMISRKMPPSREDLVTILPGTEESTEVIFDKPWMPDTKPANYKVKATGEFRGVWEKGADEVKDEELEDYTNGPLNGRVFETNEVLMKVH